MGRNSIPFFRIKERPFELLGIFAILFFIISFYPFKESHDIILHDSYFVISTQTMFGISTIYFLFIWSLYLASNKFLLSVKLTWAHVIVTILPILFIVVFALIGTPSYGAPRRYYSFEEFEKTKPLFDFTIILAMIAIMLVLGQLFLLINIIGGSIKRLVGKKQTL